MTGSRSHAAEDGSLARSTGGAAARGALLIGLAVVIGLVLMAFALDDKDSEVTSGGDPSTSSQPPSTDTDNTDDPAGATSTTADPNAAPSSSGAVATLDTTNPGTARPHGEVNVLVANGTGGVGVAGNVSEKLIADGYISKASNAPSTADSVIYYREGFDADAREVATVIGATPDVILPATGDIQVASSAVADGRLEEANIIVIVGNDGKIPTA